MVERHQQDLPGDFHGHLRARCPNCATRQTVLGTVRQGRDPSEPVRVEVVACPCGTRSLVVLVIDRWDAGFYDEGTVVAACTDCGRLRIVVDMD
jgi:DNA-directed RNA polymerase subunit RPC12/RpoP